MFRRPSLAALVATLAVVLSSPAFAQVPAPAEPAVPAQRVVSLVPSITEDLFAIGAGGSVVGVSSYSDFPPAARRLPRVATFSSVDVERIEALHPDLVVGIPEQATIVRDLRRVGLRVVLLKNEGYDDIFRVIDALGRLTGHDAAAARETATLRSRTAALLARVHTVASPPRLFVVLGLSPIYTVGDRSYIATLIAMAGGRNAATDLTRAYGTYDAEALVASDPDALVVDRSVGLETALHHAPWSDLRAVKDDHVETIPDPDVLLRPGPRFTQGLAWLVGRVAALEAR